MRAQRLSIKSRGRAPPSRRPRTPSGSAGGTSSRAAAARRPAPRRGRSRGTRPARIGLRDRAQQRLRVRVLGIRVDRLRRADLDDPAEVHDRDPVAEELRRRQVVRDVEVGQVELALELEHQLEDLGPHAHVEHRDGLVGHEQRPGSG